MIRTRASVALKLTTGQPVAACGSISGDRNSWLFRKRQPRRRKTRKDCIRDFVFAVDKTAGPDGCWFWRGGKQGTGYGMMRWVGKRILVHRLAYELAHGCAVPDGMCVCHRCNTPLCVNPAHLYVATSMQNVKDAHRDGLHNKRLTEDQRADLCAVLGGGAKVSVAARHFGVTENSARLLYRRRFGCNPPSCKSRANRRVFCVSKIADMSNVGGAGGGASA